MKARKVKPGTPGAEKVKKKSKKWYGRVPGNRQPVPLSANKTAAGQMLAALVNKAELGKAGIRDPFEEHRKRPLAEHLADWEAVPAGRAARRRSTSGRPSPAPAASSTGAGSSSWRTCPPPACSNTSPACASSGRALPPLDPAKAGYTKKELAALLGVKPSAVPSLVAPAPPGGDRQRQGPPLPEGDGRGAACPPRRGRSIKTSNLYLDAIKAVRRLAGAGPAHGRQPAGPPVRRQREAGPPARPPRRCRWTSCAPSSTRPRPERQSPSAA